MHMYTGVNGIEVLWAFAGRKRQRWSSLARTKQSFLTHPLQMVGYTAHTRRQLVRGWLGKHWRLRITEPSPIPLWPVQNSWAIVPFWYRPLTKAGLGMFVASLRCVFSILWKLPYEN